MSEYKEALDRLTGSQEPMDEDFFTICRALRIADALERGPSVGMLHAGKLANNALFVKGSGDLPPSSHFPHNAIYAAMVQQLIKEIEG